MADGWTTHPGGPCPVDGETRVDVTLRDGTEILGERAEFFATNKNWWRWLGSYEDNIRAWRHHVPAQETMSADADLLRQAVEALLLRDAYASMPSDRGGRDGPKGLAYQKFIAAKEAVLSAYAARGGAV